MKKYIESLRQYVVANPIQFDDDCDHPALDSLYWHYSSCHNMSNDKTKSFVFEGKKTDVEQAIGNAVPVKLAEYVARCILEYEQKEGVPSV